MELHEIDLNLLVVFDRLHAERRVSAVAEQLGLTQPAVSNALARLRRRLDDELFVRAATGMVPTPRAEQLAGPVRQALALLHDGLQPPGGFDPATERRNVTIGMTDIGEIYFLPRLVRHLREVAPGLTVSTVRNTAVNLQDEMAQSQVDLAVGLLPQLKGGFFQRQLFRQRYVCLFRAGHALDDGRGRLSLADFRAAEHLVVVAAGTGHGRVDERLRRAGIDRQVRLSVPHFVGVGPILQGTDLVATVPERLAVSLVQPFGLVSVPHPVALPTEPITVFWHAKAHRSPFNQWLRRRLVELFADDASAA